MIYFKSGVTQITDELALGDFHWQLIYIGLNLVTETPEAEVVMWENHAKHQRKFEFIAPPEYNQSTLISACISQLLQMPQFENSTAV